MCCAANDTIGSSSPYVASAEAGDGGETRPSQRPTGTGHEGEGLPDLERDRIEGSH